MPTNLSTCAKLLASRGIRHHVDTHDAAIRLVFVTRHYENARGEKLAIVRLETPDDGRRVRASIARVFTGTNGATTSDPAGTCLALCRLAADTPLVGIEYDAEGEGLRLVVEAAVEDARLTKQQLFAMLDRIVEAAEAWQVALRATRRRQGCRAGASRGGRRGAA